MTFSICIKWCKVSWDTIWQVLKIIENICWYCIKPLSCSRRVLEKDSWWLNGLLFERPWTTVEVLLLLKEKRRENKTPNVNGHSRNFYTSSKRVKIRCDVSVEVYGSFILTKDCYKVDKKKEIFHVWCLLF